jgi:hypothetical protein
MYGGCESVCERAQEKPKLLSPFLSHSLCIHRPKTSSLVRVDRHSSLRNIYNLIITTETPFFILHTLPGSLAPSAAFQMEIAI